MARLAGDTRYLIEMFTRAKSLPACSELCRV